MTQQVTGIQNALQGLNKKTAFIYLKSFDNILEYYNNVFQ